LVPEKAENVNKIRNIHPWIYNRLKISTMQLREKKSGTLRPEKQYFATRKAVLFPSKSAALRFKVGLM